MLMIHEAHTILKNELEEITDTAQSVSKWVHFENDQLDKKYNPKKLPIERINLNFNDNEQMRETRRVIYIPQHISESLFILAISKFEKFMIHVCDNVQADSENEIGFRDEKGDSKLKKMYRYIKKYSLFKYDICRKSSKEWSRTQKLFRLRNDLIHKHLNEDVEGLLKNDELFTAFKGINPSYNDEESSVVISLKYMHEICEFLSSFSGMISLDMDYDD
jgi:hypothetical protein